MLKLIIILFLSVGYSCQKKTKSPFQEKKEIKSRWEFKGPGQYLPLRIDKWKLIHGPRYFTRKTLHRHINGANEGFFEYGFVQLAVGEYERGQKKEDLSIEIYDMGTPLGAFGKFSRLLPVPYNPQEISFLEDIGNGAILEIFNLTFWKGKYLVKLIYLKEELNNTKIERFTKPLLSTIAEFIAKRLPKYSGRLRDLERFPQRYALPQAKIYYAKSILGIQELKAGFVSFYEAGKERFCLFYTKRKDSQSANQTLKALCQDKLKDKKCSLNHKTLGITYLEQKDNLLAGLSFCDPRLSGAKAERNLRRHQGLLRSLLLGK
jgi:hypothetical protein